MWAKPIFFADTGRNRLINVNTNVQLTIKRPFHTNKNNSCNNYL